MNAMVEWIGFNVFVRIVGWFALYCQRRGLLVYEGLDNLRDALQEGPVVIAVNHPGELETCLVPVPLFPELLRDRRLLPYSIAERKIVPRW